MLRRFAPADAALAVLADALAVAAAFGLAAWARADRWALPLLDSAGADGSTVDGPSPWFLALAAPLLWVVVLWRSALYDPRARLGTGGELGALAAGTAFAGLASAGLVYLAARRTSRALLLVAIGTAFVLLAGWRIALALGLRRSGRTGYRVRRVLVIGEGEVAARLRRLIEKHARSGLVLVGYVADDGNELGVGSTVDPRRLARAGGVDDVIITLPASDGRVPALVAELLDVPVQVWLVPDGIGLALDRPRLEELDGVPLLGLRSGPLSDSQVLAKRLLDLAVGACLLVLALPVMAVVALAVRLDSPGPILLRQPRVGENGRIFRMYKFRTMVADAERRQAEVNVQDEFGHVLHKRPDDPRVTRLGRILRRTSLDELPQLVNVLKGEMSLVGPRPELPWLVEGYEPWQRRRLVVPQGLTGWWQVNGRSSKPMHLHTEEDIYYITNYSFGLDLRILWKTIWVVLQRKGAH